MTHQLFIVISISISERGTFIEFRSLCCLLFSTEVSFLVLLALILVGFRSNSVRIPLNYIYSIINQKHSSLLVYLLPELLKVSNQDAIFLRSQGKYIPDYYQAFNSPVIFIIILKESILNQIQIIVNLNSRFGEAEKEKRINPFLAHAVA